MSGKLDLQVLMIQQLISAERQRYVVVQYVKKSSLNLFTLWFSTLTVIFGRHLEDAGVRLFRSYVIHFGPVVFSVPAQALLKRGNGIRFFFS